MLQEALEMASGARPASPRLYHLVALAEAYGRACTMLAATTQRPEGAEEMSHEQRDDEPGVR